MASNTGAGEVGGVRGGNCSVRGSRVWTLGSTLPVSQRKVMAGSSSHVYSILKVKALKLHNATV